MSSYLRKQLGRLALGGAMLLGSPAKGTPELPGDMGIAKYFGRLEQIASNNYLEGYFNGTIPAPSGNDFLKAAYGRRMDEVLANARSYQQANPDLFFNSRHNPELLESRPTIDKFPFPEIPNVGVADIENNSIDINPLPEMAKSMPSVIRHEVAHTDQQDPFMMNDARMEILELLEDSNLSLKAGTLPTAMYSPTPEKYEAQNRTPKVPLTDHDQEIGEHLNYITEDLEMEARLQALKQVYFNLGGENGVGGEVKTPADSVRALRTFGVKLDEAVIRELFEERGLAYPANAMQTETLPQNVLNQVDERTIEINQQRILINGGTPDEIRNPSHEAFAIEPKDQPPLKAISPKLEKAVLKQMIFKLPGMAMSRQMPSFQQIKSWRFAEPDSPALA